MRASGVTAWGLDHIDRPERLRRYTRIRRHIGEHRYRALRLSMSVAQSRRQIPRLFRELQQLRVALDEAQ